MTKKTDTSEASKYGLSDEYWGRLSEEHRQMYAQVRPLRKASYVVHNPIAGIEQTLGDMAQEAEKQGGKLELNPDFQRGHVWDQARQIKFMESVLRGVAPMNIRFNCAGWNGGRELGDLNPHDVVCVDGLQRLTAMRAFMAGEFPVFEKYYAKDLQGSPFALNRTSGMWVMEMFDIRNRHDLLTFYLDINSGGVVHSDEELERVRQLRDEANTPTVNAPKKPRKR